MKLLLFTLLIGLATNTTAQTNFYRYNPSTGASEKIGYSEPANSYPNSTYTPRVDLNLYQRVLASRQSAYNRNRALLQDRVDQVQEALLNLYEVNKEAGEYYEQQLTEYLNGVSRQNPDYSNENVYYTVLNGINAYYTAIRKAKIKYSDN